MSFADETHVVFYDLYSDQNPSNTIVWAPKQGREKTLYKGQMKLVYMVCFWFQNQEKQNIRAGSIEVFPILRCQLKYVAHIVIQSNPIPTHLSSCWRFTIKFIGSSIVEANIRSTALPAVFYHWYVSFRTSFQSRRLSDIDIYL